MLFYKKMQYFVSLVYLHDILLLNLFDVTSSKAIQTFNSRMNKKMLNFVLEYTGHINPNDYICT